MINIAIVDDESAILENIRKCVENEITLQDEVNIFTYTQANDFLQEMRQGSEFDILISDIDMPDMGGLELGRRIQEGSGIYLVFLTAYIEYAAESYRLEAYQYILKKDMEKRLPPILRQLIDRGHILNVSHIDSMKDGMVQMDNGVRIFVNRISIKKIKEQISLYRGNL